MKLVSKKAKCAFIALLLALGLMPMMAYAAPTGEDDSLDISNAEVVWKSEVVATDSNLCPIVSVTLNGTTLDEGQDYLIEYYRKGMYGDFSIKLPGASALPGTYQVRLLGAGPGSGYYGYYGPIIYDVVAGSSQDPIEITSIDVIDKVVGYDGTEKKPSVVVKAGDSVVSNDQLNVVYENNVNAGTATVTVTAKEDGMYFGSLSAQFTILPSEITDVTLETEEVTYNANEQKPAVKEVKAGNIVVPESAFDVAYSNNKNCGNATVTITAKENGNFTGSVEKSFTISPARITLIVLDENVFVYDGTWHEPSFKVYAGAIEVPALAYTKAYTNNLNATASASVKVSMNDGQNFTGELTKYFTILPAPLKSMTLSPTSYNYDGKQKSPTVTVKNASGKTLVDGTDYNLSTPDDRTNAGSYKYTATGKGNYTGSVSATMTIVKNGWVKEDGKWYYYDNGTAVTNKWQKDSKGWVYLGTDGAMVTNKWVRTPRAGVTSAKTATQSPTSGRRTPRVGAISARMPAWSRTIGSPTPRACATWIPMAMPSRAHGRRLTARGITSMPIPTWSLTNGSRTPRAGATWMPTATRLRTSGSRSAASGTTSTATRAWSPARRSSTARRTSSIRTACGLASKRDG